MVDFWNFKKNGKVAFLIDKHLNLCFLTCLCINFPFAGKGVGGSGSSISHAQKKTNLSCSGWSRF